MLKSLRLTTAPFIVLLALLPGCSIKQTEATSPLPTLSLPTKNVPSPVNSVTPSLSPQTDPFQDASDKAIGAATISQSAQSKDEWNVVFSMWQEAITLMKAVPKSSSNYALAQKKATEYQWSLASAKQQAVKPAPSLESTTVKQRSAQEASAPANTSTPKKVVQKLSAPPFSAQAAVKQILSSYAQAITTNGGNGHEFFCADASGAETSFFAPRSAKILNISDESETVGGGRGIYATLRIESSNKGGLPIINDFVFVMAKDSKNAKGLPGNWCIAFIKDD